MTDISRQYGMPAGSQKPRKLAEGPSSSIKVTGTIVEYTEKNELGLSTTVQLPAIDAIRNIEAICNTQNLAIKRLQARLAKAEAMVDKQQRMIVDLKSKLDQKMDRF